VSGKHSSTVAEKLIVGEGEAVTPMILRAALMAPPHIPSCCRLYYVAAWSIDEFSEQHHSSNRC
jgi:hypothetical protein